MQIVGVSPRERVMRPGFGCAVQAYVFEANDDLLPELIATDVRAAISQNEPRVLVKNVSAESNESEIVITIEYIVLPSRREQTLQITV